MSPPWYAALMIRHRCTYFNAKSFLRKKVGKNTSNIKNFSLCFYFLLALSYISFPLSLCLSLFLSLEASLMFSVFILCCCFINFVCGICYAVMAKTFAAATAAEAAAHKSQNFQLNSYFFFFFWAEYPLLLGGLENWPPCGCGSTVIWLYIRAT